MRFYNQICICNLTSKLFINFSVVSLIQKPWLMRIDFFMTHSSNFTACNSNILIALRYPQISKQDCIACMAQTYKRLIIINSSFKIGGASPFSLTYGLRLWSPEDVI